MFNHWCACVVLLGGQDTFSCGTMKSVLSYWPVEHVSFNIWDTKHRETRLPSKIRQAGIPRKDTFIKFCEFVFMVLWIKGPVLCIAYGSVNEKHQSVLDQVPQHYFHRVREKAMHLKREAVGEGQYYIYMEGGISLGIEFKYQPSFSGLLLLNLDMKPEASVNRRPTSTT